MHKSLTIVCLLAVAIVVLGASGCEDRGSNFKPREVEKAAVGNHDHVFSHEFILQLGNKYQQVYLRSVNPGENFLWDKRLPYLILLSPEGEDQEFYLHHGLVQLVEDLLASGEIEPMYIVLWPSAPVLGTFFYAGHSYGAGLYDHALGTSLIEYLEALPYLASGDQSQRGIGGFGQGAYGAYRAAILNPGTFGSVSGVDGPLDFDGSDGQGGLIPLLDSVFVEQPWLTPANFRNDFYGAGVDSSGFDTAQARPISRLFTTGALAFTPHDQNLDSLILIHPYPDTMPTELRVTIDTNLRWTAGHILTTDSTALIDKVIAEDGHYFHFHLPFTPNHRPYNPIWNYWLAENLENRLSADGSELAGVDLWLGTSPDAKWGYHNMTMSWYNTLSSRGLDPQLYEYRGYEGLPARQYAYVYDALRQILIFHSHSFNK